MLDSNRLYGIRRKHMSCNVDLVRERLDNERDYDGGRAANEILSLA